MKRGREGGNGKRRCLITVPRNRLREIPRERRRPRTGCANFSLPPEPLHVLRPLAGRSELPHRNNPVASSRHARGELEVRPAITTIALRAE